MCIEKLFGKGYIPPLYAPPLAPWRGAKRLTPIELCSLSVLSAKKRRARAREELDALAGPIAVPST
jgi:hypothetical protein